MLFLKHKYYVSTIYEGFTDIEDCVKYPDKALISSSRDRFIFPSVSKENAKAIITELFDEELYAAQYGSNLVTNCREAAIEKHQAKKNTNFLLCPPCLVCLKISLYTQRRTSNRGRNIYKS